MKKLLVTFILTILSFVTYSQTGVGYLNYTVYNIRYNQVGQFPNSAADFVNMFDTTKGTTVYKRGTITSSIGLAFMNYFEPGTPNSGAYAGIKFEGYFVPKETGVYTFGIDGDDGVDFSLDGNVVTSFYGGHGFGGYRYGTVSLVAGKTYTFMARYQNWGGGWGMYLVWKRPSQQSYSQQANEVYSVKPNPASKQATAIFGFNSNLDATKFSVSSLAIPINGSVDITDALDSTKVNTGYKVLTTSGQVEWCVIYEYDATNQRYRIGIDSREVNGILSDPTKITNLQLFDLWNGPVTFNSYDPNGWTEVYVYTPTQFNFSGSSFVSNIRAGNGFYGLQAEFAFAESLEYKPQSVSITTTNNLATLYNSIVTVSDVWLAFKEVSNIGIFGNESGKEFTYGIQYKNGDINGDGYFNEADAFRLLQHLTGAKNIVDTFSLKNTIKIIPTSNYNNIGKSNWTSSPSYIKDTITFDINTNKPIDTFNYAITWKGDINLSHSTTPASNGITTMAIRSMSINSMVVSTDVNASILTELKDSKFYAYITFDPLQQQIAGTQFQLNYDNSFLKFESVEYKTKGNPMNYGTNRGTYINLGSLITDGSSVLDNTTEYKVIFTPTKTIINGLGLVGIGTTDVISNSGKQLKVKIN